MLRARGRRVVGEHGQMFTAWVVCAVPKVGPLKIATFQTPTPQAEQLFEQSFNATLGRYRKHPTELANGQASLPNDNLDVGQETPPGKYRLNDKIYADLLDRLAKKKFSDASPELALIIEQFYANPDAPNSIKRDATRWSRVQDELWELKVSQPAFSRMAGIQ